MITFNTIKFQSTQTKTRTSKPALKNNAGLSQDSVSFSGAKLKAADFNPTNQVGKYGIKAIIAKITRFTGTIKKGNFEAEFQKGTKVGEKRFRNDGTLSVSRKFDHSGQLSEITTHRKSGKPEETLEYDGIGNLTSKTEHSSDGWKREIGFDEEGRKIGENVYTPSGKIFSTVIHDADGNIAAKTVYYENGKTLSRHEKNSSIHFRDDSTVEQLIERNEDGGHTVSEYRTDETLKMKASYHANGRLKWFTPHDEKGRPLETKLAQ